jgi:preprotein translocase subunit SecE
MARTETRSFVSELGAFNIYKRNQGRLTRQLTAAGIGLLVAVGAYWLFDTPLRGVMLPVRMSLVAVFVTVGAWLTFRLVNYAPFAEFLIAVEGEMHKVTWSSWPELWRATAVVLSTMLFLGVILYVYDTTWALLLRYLHVIQ